MTQYLLRLLRTARRGRLFLGFCMLIVLATGFAPLAGCHEDRDHRVRHRREEREERDRDRHEDRDDDERARDEDRGGRRREEGEDRKRGDDEGRRNERYEREGQERGD